MSQEHFPEKFSALPEICYSSVVDFNLRHRNEWHNTKRSDLIYVISGSLTIVLPGVSELQYHANPGDILMMKGNQAHKDIFQTNKGLKALIVSYLWMGDDDFFAAISNSPVRKFNTNEAREVRWQLERMRETVNKKILLHDNNDLLANSRLHTILLLLYDIMRHSGNENSEPVLTYKPEELLRAAENYIICNYASATLSRAEVAAALNVSVPTLSRAFEKCSGYTFLEYLTQIRLDNAITLLQDGSYRVNEIAQLCGFSDAGYFARVFKKAYGKTPGKYR